MNFERCSQPQKRRGPVGRRRYNHARFSVASRKGRDRHSAGAPGGLCDLAAGGGAVPGSTKPWKAARSIHELITKADVRAAFLICATACLSLFLLEFVGAEGTYARLYPPSPYEPDPYWVLRVKAWWLMWILIGFVMIPVIAMLCMRTKGLRDCNLSFSGFAQHFWMYVGLFVAVFPVIWLVSQTPNFYNYYPMYPAAGRSWKDFLMWEGMYAGQFIALEFFFRGFLVGGLARYMGVLAVPVSVMPYMMLHFTKPAPEAAASVVAGFVLGWLALKYKSIWGGVCVHCAVAISMDLLALSHKNQLPWTHH
jgi:membrane protease YdiL (CAAX protease family)